VPGPHREQLSGRSGWLRAAVLGADDGIVSVAAIIVGVAAAPQSTRAAILTAGGRFGDGRGVDGGR
jgi:vacuolar iron transporter family protein